ncbi:hypothetical protein O6H91_23G012500 [Diphasiastrum complanatum]|uniref:Uncharacterized protein n=1 Tax=Diphasiastrum complanatum TaxID=34168 RepID=A0ACC2A899_DIPCM|nr:hypothetical protein O6H91_23G012500 [Diphasiastrum complanatum]
MSMSTVKVKAGFLPHQNKGQEADSQGEDIFKRHPKDDVNMDHEGEGLQCSNVDKEVLLQWGQRKRQRNGRLETKAPAVEESFALPKKPVKVDRRVAVADKHAGSQQPQPPVLNRGHALRPCTPFREITFGNGQRNVEAFSSVELGSKNGRRQDLQRNITASVDKTESRESPLQDEHEMATMCTNSASGGSFVAHALERADMEAIQGRPPSLEKFDLESFEWPKFLCLSRKEKEEDFLAMRGSKLPQRPKKRSKHIEKALHYVNPGAWLSDMSWERYEVREKKTVKKRPRAGLKALDSADTDSE